MHVTYPGIKPKSRFKYYVCNNRYNHKSCAQEYIRELGKLAERRDVVSALVQEFTEHNRNRRLPDLETRRQAVLKELEGVRGEKEKLSRWLSGAGLNAQAISFINLQVDRLSEQEGQAQERLWALEDEINALQTATYNAQQICDQLAELVRAFPTFTDGERKLMVDSLIAEVALKHKEVAVGVTQAFVVKFSFSLNIYCG
jgi:chromosome segregation ATPase